MLFSFLIIVREGFEIALILAIVLGYLRKSGNKDRFGQVWAGALAAAALCVIVAGILEVTATEMAGSTREAFEGFTVLFAVAVLTWMVFWMRRQASSLGGELRGQVEMALRGGSMTAMVLLAFSAVLREGLETVLLLFAGSTTARGDSTSLFLLGALGGAAVAAALGYLVYKGSHVIPMKQFFTVTAILVIFIAAGMLSNGLGNLQESQVLGNLGSRPWDTDATLSLTTTAGKFLHTLVGYDSAPTWSQIIGYWSYLALSLGAFAVGVGSKRPSRAPQTASQTSPAASQEASRA